MSSSRIHCCHTSLVQSVRESISLSKMSCFVVQSSALGLKKKNICPFLLLENPRPLSPPWELQTLLSSSGTLDFLSTYLEIDSLSGKEMTSSTWDLLNLRMAWDLQMEMLSKHPYKETYWNPWLGEWPANISVESNQLPSLFPVLCLHGGAGHGDLCGFPPTQLCP